MSDEMAVKPPMPEAAQTLMLGGGDSRFSCGLQKNLEGEARLLIMDLGSKGCIGAGLGDEEQHGQDIMELNGFKIC